MPRAARTLGNDITYHVVANCNAKEFLFKTGSDFQDFLDWLAFCQTEFLFDLHAYCLLHSHIHLILTTRKDFLLDKVMYEICQRYSFQYNKQNGREGHFWKNRYFSKVITDDIYGLVCLRYLHKNPPKAGLTDQPEQWPWSCAKSYLTGEFGSLIKPLPSYLGLADTDLRRCKIYKRWLETPFLSEETERKLMNSKLWIDSRRFRSILRLQVEPLLATIRTTK